MPRWTSRALDRAPALLALVFLVAFLVSLGSVRETLTQNADFASAPLIAEGIGGGHPGGFALLGDYPWYEAVWMLRLTSVLPSHLQVWEFVPFFVWLAVVVFAGLAVLLTTRSRWAASITAALLVCIGNNTRQTLWSLDTHGPAAAHVALIGVAMVLVLRYPRWRSGVRGYGLAVVVGALTAVGATDPIVVPFGVAPLLVAAVALWVRRGDARLLRWSVVVAIVAVAGKTELISLAEHANMGYTLRAVTFVQPDEISRHIGWLPGAVLALTTGYAFGMNVAAPSAVAMLGGIVALVSTVAILWIAAREAYRALWGALAARRAVDGRATAPSEVARGAVFDDADQDHTWIASVVFWLSVIAASVILWTFSSSPLGASSARYLVSAWVGVCVLLPLLALRVNARTLAGAVATLICLGATVAFIEQPESNAGQGYPTTAVSEQIEAFGKAHGVTRGFAGYWDAAPISVQTRFRLQLHPIAHCGIETQVGRNCRFFEHILTQWYEPRPGPTMLVIDSSQPQQPVLDPVYQKPTAQATFGTITVYIIPVDIAPTFG